MTLIETISAEFCKWMNLKGLRRYSLTSVNTENKLVVVALLYKSCKGEKRIQKDNGTILSKA